MLLPSQPEGAVSGCPPVHLPPPIPGHLHPLHTGGSSCRQPGPRRGAPRPPPPALRGRHPLRRQHGRCRRGAALLTGQRCTLTCHSQLRHAWRQPRRWRTTSGSPRPQRSPRRSCGRESSRMRATWRLQVCSCHTHVDTGSTVGCVRTRAAAQIPCVRWQILPYCLIGQRAAARSPTFRLPCVRHVPLGSLLAHPCCRAGAGIICAHDGDHAQQPGAQPGLHPGQQAAEQHAAGHAAHAPVCGGVRGKPGALPPPCRSRPARRNLAASAATPHTPAAAPPPLPACSAASAGEQSWKRPSPPVYGPALSPGLLQCPSLQNIHTE